MKEGRGSLPTLRLGVRILVDLELCQSSPSHHDRVVRLTLWSIKVTKTIIHTLARPVHFSAAPPDLSTPPRHIPRYSGRISLLVYWYTSR